MLGFAQKASAVGFECVSRVRDLDLDSYLAYGRWAGVRQRWGSAPYITLQVLLVVDDSNCAGLSVVLLRFMWLCRRQ